MTLTIDNVFSAFGGVKGLTDVLGMSPQAVWNMKARGSIPSRHWAKLIEEAKGRIGRPDVTPAHSEILSHVNLEELLALHHSDEVKAS